jgi:hypothetical protein
MTNSGVNKSWFATCVLGRAAVVFLPLFAAVLLIVHPGSGLYRLLLFTRIEENKFIVNDVLFILIAASYGVVLFGLGFSLFETENDLYKYKGEDAKVKVLNRLSQIGLLIVLVTLTIYLCAIVFGGERIDIEDFVTANRWLSLFIFGIFFGTDGLALISQRVQEREASQAVKGQSKRSNPQWEFYKLAILLIDLPTLALSSAMIVLISHLGNGVHFRGVIDRQLHLYISTEPLRADVFSLFLNGIEAGVIASIIIFSQIVYLVLKARCDWALHVPSGIVQREI